MTDIERIKLEQLERILYPPVMLTPEMEAMDEAMGKMSFEQIAKHNRKAIAAFLKAERKWQRRVSR